MKKKIIIFTSGGGNGHISATKALNSYLSDEYEIKPVFIFEDVFLRVDPASVITFGKIQGEDVYNFFLKRRWYSIINLIYDFGYWYYNLISKSTTRIASEYLAKEKPDLVISVIPIVNSVILAACQKNNIPFMLIPTDFDVTSFVARIKKPTFRKFMVTLGSADPLVKVKVAPAQIPADQIAITGLPMRKDFFESKDIPLIKKQFGVPEDKPVIVLMMGGQGNSSIMAFAQQIANLSIPAHVIICIGRNSDVKETLKNITFAPHITTTILGFTERISDLLAMADLLITKSGSVSFAEGITMNVPMILDGTATLIYWERLNHTLLTVHDWGICLKKPEDLNTAIIKILGDSNHYQEIKKNLEAVPKMQLDLEIKPLIEKLLT